MEFPVEFSKNFNDLKSVIGYARFGRIIKFKKILFLSQLVVLVSGFEFFVWTFLEDYFYYTAKTSKHWIGGVIETHNFFIFNLSYLSSNARLPTLQESYMYFLASFIILVFLISKRNPLPKPITAWFIYLFFIYLVSSLYFMWFAPEFPYTVKDFSILYILLQTGIFLMIPILLGLSLSIFSFHWLNFMFNAFTIALTLCYSAIFAAVRYITFIAILKKLSFIHMAAMFFVLGPLMDFVYITSFYSMCVYITTKLSRRRGNMPYTWGF